MRCKLIFYLTLSFLYFVLLVKLFSYSINYNLLHEKSSLKNPVTAFLPQGWGFFTKNPKEHYQINIFDYDSGEKITKKNSHFKYFFGFSKKGRKLQMEAMIISQNIEDSLWINEYKLEKGNNVEFHKISDENLYFLRKGKFVLIRHKTIPYLWRNLPQAQKSKQLIYVELFSE
jgi:antimicrobial peptide system SdpA family protein